MISFPCPSCQRILRVTDELTGLSTKCPDCSSAATVPANAVIIADTTAITTSPALPPLPPSESAVTDEPGAGAIAPPWSAAGRTDEVEGHAGDRTAWTLVRTGLRLLQLGVIIRVGILMVVLLFMIPQFHRVATETTESRFRSDAPSALEHFQVLLVVAGLAAEILLLLGAVFLLQAPEGTRCQPSAITIVVCQSIALAGALLSQVGGLSRSAPAIVVPLTAGIAELTALLALLTFLHRIGNHLHSADLCKNVERYAVAVALSLPFLFSGIVMMAVGPVGATGGIPFVALPIGILLMMQVNLLRLAREVIRRQVTATANEP